MLGAAPRRSLEELPEMFFQIPCSTPRPVPVFQWSGEVTLYIIFERIFPIAFKIGALENDWVGDSPMQS
jgi:hypothetical protein